ncbi:MAG TPA: YdcF family protein [Leptolyngbya sp.]|nr:YdcF family protein [Leptolyngbya sp.]
MFVLGGTPDREKKAAQLAQKYPNLEIWVSSGTSEAQTIFNHAGIAPARIRSDRQATDTVTNFTTMLGALEQRNIHHVYLVTSDFHMGRATAIATLIFGSQGIAFTPAPIRNPYYPKESPLRTLRDVGRALVWVVTGRTGSSLRDR